MTRVLLVCTGNICRSPMAEAAMRREFERHGRTDITVESAGTGAWDGASASEAAYLVALENELDLSKHRATLLTRELVEQVDVILTMARHHRTRVEELGGQGKAYVLGEYVGKGGADAEVSDPFGGSLEVYRETFAEIVLLIEKAVAKIAGEAREPDNG